jgi:hypothetical protein
VIASRVRKLPKPLIQTSWLCLNCAHHCRYLSKAGACANCGEYPVIRVSVMPPDVPSKPAWVER